MNNNFWDIIISTNLVYKDFWLCELLVSFVLFLVMVVIIWFYWLVKKCYLFIEDYFDICNGGWLYLRVHKIYLIYYLTTILFILLLINLVFIRCNIPFVLHVVVSLGILLVGFYSWNFVTNHLWNCVVNTCLSNIGLSLAGCLQGQLWMTLRVIVLWTDIKLNTSLSPSVPIFYETYPILSEIDSLSSRPTPARLLIQQQFDSNIPKMPLDLALLGKDLVEKDYLSVFQKLNSNPRYYYELLSNNYLCNSAARDWLRDVAWRSSKNSVFMAQAMSERDISTAVNKIPHSFILYSQFPHLIEDPSGLVATNPQWKRGDIILTCDENGQPSSIKSVECKTTAAIRARSMRSHFKGQFGFNGLFNVIHYDRITLLHESNKTVPQSHLHPISKQAFWFDGGKARTVFASDWGLPDNASVALHQFKPQPIGVVHRLVQSPWNYNAELVSKYTLYRIEFYNKAVLNNMVKFAQPQPGVHLMVSCVSKLFKSFK